MFKFITNKPFWVNLLAAMALAFLLIFMVLQLLGWITRHGEYLTVPSVNGKPTSEAIKLLEDKGFDVVIQDSVYTDTLKRGTVIKQLPDPNSTVKINRTVFITVNRFTPPMINMPALEGNSLNYALDILQRTHLKLGDTIFRADFMKGSVIEQRYKGNKILPGAKVQWGSSITLVVSGGLKEDNIRVPDLLGMTYGEAKATLDSLGVIVTLVLDPSVRDTMNAFIYKQNPAHLDDENRYVYIRQGMVMDIWLSPVKINLNDTTEQNK
jgi:eukaryotic-like serine/threonine-protein kinase